MALPETVRTLDLLEQTGLSQRAINRVHRIGNEVARYGWLYLKYGIPPTVLVLSYLAKLAALQQVQPDVGLLTNLFSATPFVDIPSPDSQYGVLNAQLAASHVLEQLGLFFTAGEGIGGAISMTIGGEKARRGEQKIGYPNYNLCVDLTNDKREGSHQGDFYQELLQILENRKDLKGAIWEKWGPIVEMVPADVPLPPEKPKAAYLRAAAWNNAKFLEETACAWKITASLIVLMDRSHTVFDRDEESFQRIKEGINELNNMNETINQIRRKRKKGTPNIPKVAIANDRKIPAYGLLSSVTGERNTVAVELIKFLEDDGYMVINAEETITDFLITRFRDQKYERLIVIDDGTDRGGEIAKNWHDYYNAQKEKLEKQDGSGLPEILYLNNEDEIKTKVEAAPGDKTAIFIIGENDTDVAATAKRMLNKQYNGEFGEKRLPIEALMEGRGSYETVAQRLDDLVEEAGEDSTKLQKIPSVNIHYVHEVLARRYIQLLLPEMNIKW